MGDTEECDRVFIRSNELVINLNLVIVCELEVYKACDEDIVCVHSDNFCEYIESFLFASNLVEFGPSE